MEERLGEQNRVKHPESVETPCASSPGEQRNAAGILASFAFGLLLALGASALWGFYADGLLRDGRMRRIIQLHGFADHYESYAVSRVGGGSSGTAAVEIPSARLGYSGLRSASILFPSRLPHGSGLNADSGSLIVRYTKLSPAGSSVFFYDDTDWNKQHYNYIYAKNSIIITILSIVIIAISPIAVTLFSMFRRRDELRRFSNTAGSFTGEYPCGRHEDRHRRIGCCRADTGRQRESGFREQSRRFPPGGRNRRGRIGFFFLYRASP